MDLILNLLTIVYVIFSPYVPKGSLPLLDILIREHRVIFKELFPAERRNNKHHHLDHYPEAMAEFGPSRGMWCMRFEGKLEVFSKHRRVMCN